MEKSPAQHLCDILYALTIQVKYMDNLIEEHKKNMRSDDDFSMRFQSQSELLCSNLKQIKPTCESLIKIGYSRIEDARSKCANTENEVQSGESKELDTITLVQDKEGGCD